MLKRGLGKKNLVGLDIGSSSVKAVELDGKRGSLQLVSLGYENLQPDSIVDGQIMELNNVSNVIANIFRDHQIKTDRVAAGVSGASEVVAMDDSQLAAIPGVHEAGRIDNREPVARCETRTRLDEAGITVGNRNRQAGADERPLAGAELDTLARSEIEAGVTCIGALRDDCICMQSLDRKFDQRARRAGSERASATR